MTLADAIKQARAKKGWTIRELEKKSGVHNSMITHIETGHTKDPLFSTASRLAKVLKINLSKIETPVKPQ